jgi:hypothetical protein
MDRHVRRIANVMPADDWFEVRGTKEHPSLTRLAFWAHCKYSYRDSQSGEFSEEMDIVIGVTGVTAVLSADDYQAHESPAGYVHINDLIDGASISVSMLETFCWE